MTTIRNGALAFAILLCAATANAAVSDEKLAGMKADVAGQIEQMKTQTQIMVDSIYSFGELGFQEYETQKYLTGILEKEGFTVKKGISGIPTAWVATWGSGKPVIALGADIDDIPQASQKPGVAYHDPLIAGAPGHGEGHNAGQAVLLTAALAVKKIMQQEHMSGTLKIWPGIAEELLGAKAFFVRDGLFKDVDVSLFTHVGDNFSSSWGPMNTSGLISVEFQFKGESAHAAGAPWRGRSALDAVELMDVGWNFRREHLRLQQRSHYVISNGGDQPNVVPPNASVWYYFRELDYEHIKGLWDIAENMAKGATLMTDTTYTSRVLGAAWPAFYNKPLSESFASNIEKVGMPQWSEDDQTLAKGIQRELKQKEIGLRTKARGLVPPLPEEQRTGGSSNDLGDVSWSVPTALLYYPANIPNLPGHNWANGIAMATPLAHKGTTAGAKVMAMTILDVLTKPELVVAANDYFQKEQLKDTKYHPLIRPEDKPAIWINQDIMAKYRDEMKKQYYDPTKYKSYLDQLGIKYPTVR